MEEKGGITLSMIGLAIGVIFFFWLLYHLIIGHGEDAPIYRCPRCNALVKKYQRRCSRCGAEFK